MGNHNEESFSSRLKRESGSERDQEDFCQRLVGESKDERVTRSTKEVSFSERIRSEQQVREGDASFIDHLDDIYIVKAKEADTSRPAWYFVKVYPAKRLIFDRVVSAGNFDLADYGEILDSGYGEDPPEEVKKKYFRE